MPNGHSPQVQRIDLSGFGRFVVARHGNVPGQRALSMLEIQDSDHVAITRRIIKDMEQFATPGTKRTYVLMVTADKKHASVLKRHVEEFSRELSPHHPEAEFLVVQRKDATTAGRVDVMKALQVLAVRDEGFQSLVKDLARKRVKLDLMMATKNWQPTTSIRIGEENFTVSDLLSSGRLHWILINNTVLSVPLGPDFQASLDAVLGAYKSTQRST